MAEAKTYLNNRLKGEHADAYAAGGFHPVYLGDVLGGRYQVFRKLGKGSQCTVWLARDKKVPTRRYQALKVYSARSSEDMQKVVNSLERRSSHPGEGHVELPFDSFTIQGPRGNHLCAVVEPLGCPIVQLEEAAYEKRVENGGGQGAVPGDPWSVVFAKRACRQALVALDYLHQRCIAHRDIAGRNICFALQYDLSASDENEIMTSVWPEEKRPEEEARSDQVGLSATTEAKSEQLSDLDSESESSSESDDDEPPPQWRLDLDECEKRIAEQWAAYEPGDAAAKPLSDAWNKANFWNSREDIELLQRKDGNPLGPDEIRYTVAPAGLSTGFNLGTVADPERAENFRLVMTDLGFSCPFEECGKRPIPTVVDYMAPESLLGLPDVPAKSDIFSLGLWFWEVVMLRGLVVDAGFQQPRGRVLQYLARRLGPVPASLRAHWGPDADQFVDAGSGRPLDTPDEDEEEYGDDDFPRGDIWFHARKRRPLDMSDEDMGAFVHLIQRMLQWEPERRPPTEELLQDEWFRRMSGLT
ncbi:kinase-like protein [Apiospora rasikravindrae]|uniref:non-specific serine/threonine protein kinase n=1 Tax=Apiospora rasikravindrae TaxID=990691 RepID=A0ABR1RVU4_9PEZI